MFLGVSPREQGCLFRRSDKRGTLIVGVHVDDCVVAASNQKVFDKMMRDFKYPVSDCGPLEYCLGLQVDYNGKRLILKQTADIVAMATRFGVDTSKPKYTPMECNLKMSKLMSPQDEKEKAYMDKIPYRNLLGALQYSAWN